MATITGTIKAVNLLRGASNAGGRKQYEVIADFAAYTASTDDAALAGVPAAIQNITKNGKTLTLLGSCGGQPGLDSSGNPVYASPEVTVSGTTLAFNLGGVTAEADAAACTGVGLIVSVLES